MSALHPDHDISPEPVDRPAANAGAARLPRLRGFDLATFRDEPRPALVPPPPPARDEPQRDKPAIARLPSCGEVILGPSERPTHTFAPTSAAPPVVPRPRRLRPALWAAGLVAVMIAAVPILATHLASGSLGGALMEGRSSSAAGVRMVSVDGGVPLITADPRPYKQAVPPGATP